jgi:hypothetical protein
MRKKTTNKQAIETFDKMKKKTRHKQSMEPSNKLEKRTRHKQAIETSDRALRLEQKLADLLCKQEEDDIDDTEWIPNSEEESDTECEEEYESDFIDDTEIDEAEDILAYESLRKNLRYSVR